MTSVFSAMNSVPLICYFRSNRILSVPPKHTTRCHRFHNRKNSLPLILCFFWSSSTQWILSSTSITFLSLLCSVSQGPNPFTTNSRGRERDYIFIKPFLEIDVKGGERDHIKAYHLEREITSEKEREILQGERDRSPGGENTSRKYFSRIPDAWCSRGEMPHVFLRGKTCSSVIISYELWFSVPYLLLVSHARFRGSKTSKGKKFFKFIAHLYL